MRTKSVVDVYCSVSGLAMSKHPTVLKTPAHSSLNLMHSKDFYASSFKAYNEVLLSQKNWSQHMEVTNGQDKTLITVVYPPFISLTGRHKGSVVPHNAIRFWPLLVFVRVSLSSSHQLQTPSEIGVVRRTPLHQYLPSRSLHCLYLSMCM